MTLIEIINAKDALQKYSDSIPPGATMFKAIKFIKFAEEQERYFNDVRAQMLAKYGERDAAGKYVPSKDGKGYNIKREHTQIFLKESLELQNTEVEYSPSFTLDELSPLGIKFWDMYAIFPIIKEE